MPVYSVADAKNQLPKLIDRALAGEEVVITRRGRPVVELRPASASAAPQPSLDAKPPISRLGLSEDNLLRLHS